MNIKKVILYPFSLLYKLITDFRNHLYNIGHKRSLRFDTNIISVGNLSVGGTGKTPMVEYLINLLKSNYHIATLSRGYRRKTKGFRIADEKDSATTLGDEPYQFYLKFSGEITVAVGEARALAIPSLLLERPHTDLILLDDAFQHRSVIPDLNILLTDFHKPFYDDYPIPLGRLREARKGARRADIIIITKCPQNINEKTMNQVKMMIKNYTRQEVNIFFSTICYSSPRRFYDEKSYPLGKNILLVTGIANSTPLEKHLYSDFTISSHLKYKDHHYYTKKDFMHIKNEFEKIKSKEKCIITTEKDMVKLRTSASKVYFKHLPFFYIPIETTFIQNKTLFDQKVCAIIKKTYSDE